MMEQKITYVDEKITLMEPDEVQVIPESIESLLEGRGKLNYSVRSYTIGELKGELTLFSLYKDYKNPDFTQYDIEELLKQIKKSDLNQSYLKIHKNLIGESIWVDTSPKSEKQRMKEKKTFKETSY
jgi:hypothetical protein